MLSQSDWVIEQHIIMVDISRLIVALSDYEESKWFIHEKRLCAQLGIDEGDLLELLQRIKNGGTGSRKKKTFQPNPEPCNVPLDLKSTDENALNCHLIQASSREARIDIAEPTPDIIRQRAKYFQFGELSKKNRRITVEAQRELADFVTDRGRCTQLTPYWSLHLE